MQIFRRTLGKICSLKIILYLIILIIIGVGCRRRDMPLVIHPKLVYSEMDTFVASVGDTQFNKLIITHIMKRQRNGNYKKNSLS
jgi:hypothetical protein